MTFPLTAQTVRDYMGLEVDSTSKYTDTTIGSNMRAALGILERKTHRYLGDRTQTLKFTTQGRPYVTIPGLRTVGAVTLVGASLTIDETFHLIPDAQHTGLFTGVQLKGFAQNTNGPWWLSSPEWFDRNLDSPYHPANRGLSSVPNDLIVPGSWGFGPLIADWPDDALMALKVMTAYLTELASANSAGASYTTDGNIFDLSNFPDLVQAFIRDWSISQGVGGA